MVANISEIQAQQLNPLTPMAFLSPDDGYEATIAAYVMVGSIGALIWDILMNVDSDYKLLFRHKIRVPTITYFVSRSSVLVYVIVNVLFQTAALPNCQVIKKTVCVLYHVAFSSTSLLFFLRVRAVFNKNRYVTAFFFLLWLGVLGGSLTVATVGNAVHLGPTKYCRATGLKKYASAAPITFAINDTFVFLAISWQLMRTFNVDRDKKMTLKSILLGEYLPAFSRALLQDGQVYYLVSVTSNIIVAVATWVAAVPLSYRLMFTIFNVALTNMMACRVYRHTKFGDFSQGTPSTGWVKSQIANLDLEAGQKSGGLRFAGTVPTTQIRLSRDFQLNSGQQTSSRASSEVGVVTPEKVSTVDHGREGSAIEDAHNINLTK